MTDTYKMLEFIEYKVNELQTSNNGPIVDNLWILDRIETNYYTIGNKVYHWINKTYPACTWSMNIKKMKKI